MLCFGLFQFVFATCSMHRRFNSSLREWPAFPGDPPTLVFTRADLQRIWEWEIDSGHYPTVKMCVKFLLAYEQVHSWSIQMGWGTRFTVPDSDRSLLVDPGPSPSTTKSGQITTEAAAGFEVYHGHQWNRA